MNAVTVKKHGRKWPQLRKERYYFGVVDLAVTAFIKARNMDDAWEKFGKLYVDTISDIDVRPMRCDELARYLAFNKKGFCFIRK